MGEGGGVVVVSTGNVGGTGGSGIVSSAADVLGMSLVSGMGGVSGVCMCLAHSGVEGEVVSGSEEGVWALPILLEQVDCWACVCV